MFTKICIWLIKVTNKYRDNGLARQLFELSQLYDTRPVSYEELKKLSDSKY